MKNLYSFSKDAWHIKLCKWLYNIDVKKSFTNFCPYFWLLVLTFSIFPFVVFAKLCGNLSTIIYRYINVRKEVNYQKRKQKFLEYCKLVLTPEAAYKLYYSDDWDKFCYHIPNELWDKIYTLKNQYTPPKKRKQINIDWDIVFIIFLILVLIGCTAGLLLSVKWDKINWKLLGEALITVINIFVMAVGFYNIWKYLFVNDKVIRFLGKVWGYIKNIFNKIWHGIQIVSDMIYNIYKKNCPLMEIRNEESN